MKLWQYQLLSVWVMLFSSVSLYGKPLQVNVKGVAKKLKPMDQLCLSIEVKNARNIWMETKTICQKLSDPKATDFTIDKPDTPFALKVFHDMTPANGKPDYYFYLIPKEGMGISNIADPFGGFSFDDAELSPSTEGPVVLQLTYLML